MANNSCQQHANCNRRQLSVVKKLIEMWAPFVSIAEIFEAVSRPAKSCHAKLLAVKNVVIMRMMRATPRGTLFSGGQ